MATYAIGDVHGSFATLRRLLEGLGAGPGDRLWLVGDLVNRGPRSLDVLRWAADQGESRLVAVLGNHDLHLLARAAGVAKPKRRDTLEEVLEAPDRDDLLAWLRGRPLLHREGERVLVHAGLLPAWTAERAEALAREAEAALQGPEGKRLLARYKEEPPAWRDNFSGLERIRTALAAFTRLRTLSAKGRPCDEFSGPPADAPRGCLPWFEVPGRRSAGAKILFGHWAALGLHLKYGLAGLDTGCAWGRVLTALRLDDGKVFQEPAAG